jgi:hypothetical protein
MCHSKILEGKMAFSFLSKTSHPAARLPKFCGGFNVIL